MQFSHAQPDESGFLVPDRVLRLQFHRRYRYPLVLVSLLTITKQGLVIWAVLDPANPFVTPQSAPILIGLAYGVMIWGFADITISTNLARDLGTRFAAAIFYGHEVFTYMNYSWISILVNVPATFFATFVYEGLLRDSLDRIGTGHATYEGGETGLQRHLSNVGYIRQNGPMMEPGATNATVKKEHHI